MGGVGGFWKMQQQQQQQQWQWQRQRQRKWYMRCCEGDDWSDWYLGLVVNEKGWTTVAKLGVAEDGNRFNVGQKDKASPLYPFTHSSPFRKLTHTSAALVRAHTHYTNWECVGRDHPNLNSTHLLPLHPS